MAFMAVIGDADTPAARTARAFVEESLSDDLADPHAHYMSHPRTGFFIAEYGGDIAGIFGIDHWDGDQTIAQLRRVAVHLSYQRRGIGRTMMVRAEEFAHAKGYRSLRFYTAEPLQAAISMYESLGYRLVARHQFGPIPGREYEKRLTE
jgi:ribosomal protein S18 acetylase RimI-like enzyme